MQPASDADVRDTLAAFTRTLGEPWREWVILAEGNTSRALGPDRLLVKASGSRMGTATAADFVEVDTSRLTRLLDAGEIPQAELTAALMAARVDGGPRPSIEVLVHAVCVRLGGATVVGHTHPVSVNQILCSTRADALVAGSLFPDQVVVLGRAALLVPYASPGVPLARAVHAGLTDHLARHGRAPKVLYLVNHGIFVLGASEADVLATMEMAVKAAKILTGVLAIAEPRYLSATEVDTLDGRDDEELRRRLLFGGA